MERAQLLGRTPLHLSQEAPDRHQQQIEKEADAAIQHQSAERDPRARPIE